MNLWADLLPYKPPDAYTLNQWLLSHGVESVTYAIKETSLKRVKLNGQMEREDALRLCGAICSQ